MPLHPTIAAVTERIRARSEGPRRRYLDTMARAAAEGPRRAHLTCGNQAHAYAAMGDDKAALTATTGSTTIRTVASATRMVPFAIIIIAGQ